MGFHAGANKGNSALTDSAEFRTYRFPDTFNVADVKKYAIGKFNRYVLMNDGRIYWQGRCKHYVNGIGGCDSCVEFKEHAATYFANGDDKTVDIVGGKHFLVSLSESGRIRSTGYMFFREIQSEFRKQEVHSEDLPIEITMPDGFEKAVKLFASMKERILWANLVKPGGTVKTMKIGECKPWTEMKLVEDSNYLVDIQSCHYHQYGIDNEGRLYVWGMDGTVKKHFPYEEGQETPDCLANRDDLCAPTHVKWFTEQKLKVLKVKVGECHAIVLA